MSSPPQAFVVLPTARVDHRRARRPLMAPRPQLGATLQGVGFGAMPQSHCGVQFEPQAVGPQWFDLSNIDRGACVPWVTKGDNPPASVVSV